MPKKFFYNRVYNIRRIIVNLSLVTISLFAIILTLILVNNSELTKGKNKYGIKNEVIVEINEKIDNETFFYADNKDNSSQATITYPEDFSNKTIGNYTILVSVAEETYNVNLSIVDTKKPELVTKNVSIKEGETYKLEDFVLSCKDNSEMDCIISYYNALNEDGLVVDYSKIEAVGNYTIKISAKDGSNNETIEEATLSIIKKGGNKETTPEPVTCKYGNNSYDKNELLVVDVTSNGCAANLELYKNEDMLELINNVIKRERTRFAKDANGILEKAPCLIEQIEAIQNTEGTGFVGYSLTNTVYNATNCKQYKKTTDIKEEDIIAIYKLDKDLNRVYTYNPKDLPK